MGCLLLVSMFAKKTALVPLLFKSATTKKKPNKTNLSVLLKREPELYYPAELLVLNPGPDFYVTKPKPNKTKTPSSLQTKTKIFYPAEIWVLNPDPGPGFIYNNRNYLKSGIRVPDPDLFLIKTLAAIFLFCCETTVFQLRC
jgi:hypothetical protein